MNFKIYILLISILLIILIFIFLLYNFYNNNVLNNTKQGISTDEYDYYSNNFFMDI